VIRIFLNFVLTGNDLYRLHPENVSWTKLIPVGDSPSIRYGHGFTSGPQETLYLFGGYGSWHGGEHDVNSFMDLV
jgi:hypothetical protein